MCREFDSNEEYEAWVLERGRQEDEDRYWAEQEAREQERQAYWAAEMNAERDYYCYMAPLFWYANGFYDNAPAGEGEEG